MRIRINEALLLAEMAGRKIKKKDLAAILWPDSSPKTQVVNMSNLAGGQTRKISPEWVVTICRETGVSADFLFGLKDVEIDV